MASKTALIVVENSYPPFDIRVWYEATTLRDEGWKVAVICPAPENETPQDAPEDLEGVRLYKFKVRYAKQGITAYIREYGTAFYAIARLCRRVWQQTPFDVIHFCNPPDLFFSLMWWYRLRGVRVIFDHHDLLPEYIAARYPNFPGRVLYGIARVSELLSLRSAHVVISTNESYRQTAIRRGGVSGERVIVVRNGPREHTFKPQDPVRELKAGLPYLVCFAGIMGHHDGVLDLIESIKYIVHEAKRSDIRFVLLGDGAAYPQVLSEVQTNGLSEIVFMPGMIRDRAVLREYLATADVCVSPEPSNPLNNVSTFIKIGEYLAMGKPVVAYDLVESRATADDAAVYVSHGDTAAYGQAIIDLIDDPERRATMGARGRQRVLDTLAWERQQAHLLRAYALAQCTE